MNTREAVLTREELNWLVKYAECVIYLCSDRIPNPHRPGKTFVTIIPDGGEWRYRRIYNADYFDAVSSCLVPPELIRETVGEYLIPAYAVSWLEECARQGWTEENPQFIAKNVYQYYKMSGDISLFSENEDVIKRYLLENTAHFIPEPGNGTLYFSKDDVMDADFNKRGYGFHDNIHLVGYNLFATLLLWESYVHMVSMYEATHNSEQSERFRNLAVTIQRNLLDMFWDEEKQLLLAATEVCRQADVWGSAYAAAIGILDEDTAATISRSLARHYKSIVWRGQVRQMLEPDGWESAIIGKNQYQNGGFWGTATGWMFRALLKTDRELADKTVADAIRDYRRRGAHEWVHPRGNRAQCLHYVGNVGLLVKALIEEGYLEPETSHCFGRYLQP